MQPPYPPDANRERLDRQLRALPVWTPPPAFADQVVARALRERRQRLAAAPSHEPSSTLRWALAVLGVAIFATWSAATLPPALLASLWTLIAVCVGLAETLRTLVDRLYAPAARGGS